VSADRQAPLTERLADFVAEFTPAALPAPVLARAVAVTKDGAACLLAAADPAFSTGRLIAVSPSTRAAVPRPAWSGTVSGPVR
jgi:hypothetical protein